MGRAAEFLYEEKDGEGCKAGAEGGVEEGGGQKSRGIELLGEQREGEEAGEGNIGREESGIVEEKELRGEQTSSEQGRGGMSGDVNSLGGETDDRESGSGEVHGEELRGSEVAYKERSLSCRFDVEVFSSIPPQCATVHGLKSLFERKVSRDAEVFVTSKQTYLLSSWPTSQAARLQLGASELLDVGCGRDPLPPLYLSALWPSGASGEEQPEEAPLWILGAAPGEGADEGALCEGVGALLDGWAEIASCVGREWSVSEVLSKFGSPLSQQEVSASLSHALGGEGLDGCGSPPLLAHLALGSLRAKKGNPACSVLQLWAALLDEARARWEEKALLPDPDPDPDFNRNPHPNRNPNPIPSLIPSHSHSHSHSPSPNPDPDPSLHPSPSARHTPSPNPDSKPSPNRGPFLALLPRVESLASGGCSAGEMLQLLNWCAEGGVPQARPEEGPGESLGMIGLNSAEPLWDPPTQAKLPLEEPRARMKSDMQAEHASRRFTTLLDDSPIASLSDPPLILSCTLSLTLNFTLSFTMRHTLSFTLSLALSFTLRCTLSFI